MKKTFENGLGVVFFVVWKVFCALVICFIVCLLPPGRGKRNGKRHRTFVQRGALSPLDVLLRL